MNNNYKSREVSRNKVLPSGVYTAKMVKVTNKVNRKGYKKIEVVFKIIEGRFAGCNVLYNIFPDYDMYWYDPPLLLNYNCGITSILRLTPSLDHGPPNLRWILDLLFA